MFAKNPTEYEVMRLQVRHPLYSDSLKANDGTALAIYEGDVDDLNHAASEGWEVRTSVSLPVPDSKGRYIEQVILQRSNLHPKFGVKTYSDEYLNESKKIFNERKELYS